MYNPKAHLKRLVETHAPSGYETPVAELLRDEWAALVDEFASDRLGSLIGIKRGHGGGRKIMLAAHMDEIGLMVREIVDGFVFVHRISGIDPRVMLAQPVLVHGKRVLPGVVATMPPHMLTASDRKHYPPIDALVVDLGLPAREVEQIVQIGDLVTMDAPMIELKGRLAASKAMDDRACIAAITTCLELLRGMRHEWDVYAAATVQEEVGLRGATTAANHIQPDCAIALDVGFAEQPGVANGARLGEGPQLGIGANFHPKLVKRLQEVAAYHDIGWQHDIMPARSGTDAWAIQVARAGVPTALLSIPLRNMHSPVETLDIKDIERCGRLLAHFICALDDDFVEYLSLLPALD
ncbi:MAG: M42 family metallopeptidase [Chloroflexi bacterium]|nr:M42 family metallopeptidase [Chloroflexota bacterium]MCY4246794.1 M42 family metallopeptidase [Chloroflexota bacterium]